MKPAIRLHGLGTSVFAEMTTLAAETGSINLGQGFLGWASGPAELVAGTRLVKQYLTFAGGTPLQHAAAAALRVPPAIVDGLREELRAKRDQLCDGLRAAGLQPLALR